MVWRDRWGEERFAGGGAGGLGSRFAVRATTHAAPGEKRPAWPNRGTRRPIRALAITIRPREGTRGPLWLCGHAAA